jgi:uncharacterized metal-binding protein YceD (DUF177 family)
MSVLDWTHAVRDVPAAGLGVERNASVDERRRLAEELAIVSVDALVAKYRITPLSKGRLGVTGRVETRVTQECVVTLDPVTSSVSVPLDVIFTPESHVPEPEIEGSLEDLESPDEESIENGVVDMGRIIVEELVSGLDPYPRREGASLDWTDEKKAAAEANPFAALARLKRSSDPE